MDPGQPEPYFFLGETARPLLSESRRFKRDDWTSVALALIHSAYFYHREALPGDPKTIRLQSLWLEAKKTWSGQD